MKSIVILISKLLYIIGKMIGKGSSMPGKIALKLDKNILKKISLPSDIIVVTGSNGKTSTVEMICSTLEANGYNVGCNKEGSNQTEGVTTMILNASNLKGEVKKDVLVIESDERYLRHTLKHFRPKYLVVTNLYRDQMTRNGHPELIYNIIKEAITDDIHLILNADDPLSSLYGFKRENVTYFGMSKNEFSKEENDSAYDDGAFCPNCKEPMKYAYYHYNHIGSYKCEHCGHERQNPQYEVTSLDLENSKMTINNKHRLTMTLRSVYTAYNLLATYSVTKLLGMKEEKIVESLNNFVAKNDRVQKFVLNGKPGMLLTSKHENSISYNQSLLYVTRENRPCSVIIIVDAVSRKYFTSETSWLWDIDFELLNNKNVKKVFLAGKYVSDLVTRFEYSDIDMNKVIVEKNIDEMIEVAKEKAEGEIYLVTCFSDRMKFMNKVKGE